MTTTTRLALYEPTDTEVVNVVTAIDEQLDIIDDAAVATECTSSTRPITNLYAGRLAYETDTRLLIRYNGTVWQNMTGSFKRPRGKIGFTSTTTSSSAIAENAESGVLLSLTWTALAGRKYAVYFGGSVAVVAGNDASAAYKIRKANGATVTNTSTLVFTFGADADDNSTGLSTRHDGFCEHSPNAGEITIGLFLARPATGDAKTVQSASYQYLAIEDVE